MKTIGDSKLSFEELSTLLSQIKACVNSRPLCKLSTDPNDVGVLTPSHFLIGESAILPPEQNHLESKINWLTRWQRLQQMVQYFWKRWQSYYLNQLQTKTKWRHQEDAPRIDDAVLIREENLPSAQWQTGIVTDMHPGDDGFVRVVSLKVGDATMKRPITKICPFPRDESGNTITTNVAEIKNYRMKNFRVLPMIMTLLAICTPFVHAASVDNAIQVSKFDTPLGFYFEKVVSAYVADSKWNLVAFVDLGKFNGSLKLYNQSSEVESVCRKRFEKGNSCEQWVNMIHQRLAKLKDEFEAISNSPKHSKRAVLDFIGDIAGDIFLAFWARDLKMNIKVM